MINYYDDLRFYDIIKKIYSVASLLCQTGAHLKEKKKRRGVFYVFLWIVLLALNSLTYLISICLFDKGTKIVTVREGSDSVAVYLVGGCQCRTVKPFEFMLETVPKGVPIYLVEYRNRGFDIQKAVVDIEHHITMHSPKQATFVTISMGWQLAARAGKYKDKIIALNPCTGKSSLHKEIQDAIKWLPLGYAISVVLGWFSYIPTIKINGRPYYSLKLLLDQFSACANDDTDVEHLPHMAAVALSKQDRVVNNDYLLEHLSSERVYWLDTVHFGMTDNNKMYYNVVADNLARSLPPH